ncbi:hypothetical protein ACK302_18350 [Aeromonas caviae]
MEDFSLAALKALILANQMLTVGIVSSVIPHLILLFSVLDGDRPF